MKSTVMSCLYCGTPALTVWLLWLNGQYHPFQAGVNDLSLPDTVPHTLPDWDVMWGNW